MRSATTPHAPASAGFLDPLDALVSASTSQGSFTLVRPWGLTLQGFSFQKIARASRLSLAFVTLKQKLRTIPVSRLQGFQPLWKCAIRRKSFRHRRTGALLGFSLSKVCPSVLPVLVVRAPSRALASRRSVPSIMKSASQGNRAEGRIGVTDPRPS